MLTCVEIANGYCARPSWISRATRALVGDGAAELGLADRAPHADDEDPVGDDTEEVTLETEVARDDGRQHEVSTHTEAATAAIAVSRTSLTSCNSYAALRESLDANSAVPLARSQMRSASPRSHER
jgi:hypothetical protein